MLPENRATKEVGWVFFVALFLSTVFVPPRLVIAQVREESVRIHAAMVLDDFQVKAIPLLGIRVVSDTEDTLEIRTDLNGTVEVSLARGSYHLETLRPIDFGGMRHLWLIAFDVETEPIEITLTQENSTFPDPVPGGMGSVVLHLVHPDVVAWLFDEQGENHLPMMDWYVTPMRVMGTFPIGKYYVNTIATTTSPWSKENPNLPSRLGTPWFDVRDHTVTHLWLNHVERTVRVTYQPGIPR